MATKTPPLGTQIRNARERSGLTQAELCEQVCSLMPDPPRGATRRPRGYLTQPTLARYEAGDRDPHLPVLRALAKALNTSFTVGAA